MHSSAATVLHAEGIAPVARSRPVALQGLGRSGTLTYSRRIDGVSERSFYGFCAKCATEKLAPGRPAGDPGRLSDPSAPSRPPALPGGPPAGGLPAGTGRPGPHPVARLA